MTTSAKGRSNRRSAHPATSARGGKPGRASGSGGQVLARSWKSGRGYALRFHAYGKRQYVTLGLERDGWDRQRAEAELANVMADVRRGLWRPPERRPPARGRGGRAGEQEEALGFDDFAEQWIAGRCGEVSERTIEHDRWALDQHLFPYFKGWALADITIQAVDAYRRDRVALSEHRRVAIERGRPMLDAQDRPLRPLAAVTINKTIDVLQSILAHAVEYGHIPSNPASGRRRRLKRPPRRPVFVDTVDQIQALLDAAAMLDAQPGLRITDRFEQTATLLFAGPRAEEHSLLLRRDVDLANGRLHVGRSKTQAGLREISLLPILRAILEAYWDRRPGAGPDDPLFPTEKGTVRDRANVRNRVLAPVLALADELLIERGQLPLPKGLSPHKLRHTFASILVACGEDPASVMAQLGHTDPMFTLRVYTHMMRRDKAERARLKALVEHAADTASVPPPEPIATAVPAAKFATRGPLELVAI